ncbi:Retrotransposon protein [Phytophthora megakarya]|uniref:Retrotransposon protein n=1 Tax=Phytophthora megakarya TaxID=4795 RepID=A0A225WL35_9STRA|nr:Retrotransposon protein [Phytophthora megakarya]
MPEDEETQSKYVLVIKKMSVASSSLFHQGPHFKNAVIETLTRSLGAQHHFVTAYCPWANGTVEVVSRLLL